MERVEAVIEVKDPALRRRLEQILHHALWDNRLSWELNSEDGYRLRIPAPGEPVRNYHEVLMRDAEWRRAEEEEEEVDA